jgi:flagellar hook-associated protein 2
LDTGAIISSLIEVERIPVERLLSRKTEIQAKDTAWQGLNTKFSAIRTSLSSLDTRQEINRFAIAQSSDETVVTASATGSVTPGSISFTVDQLAAVHQLAGDTDFSAADDLIGAGDFTITVDGVDHTVTATASTTVAELSRQINGLEVGVSARVIDVDGTSSKLLLTADESGEAGVFTTSGTIASLSSFATVEQGVNAEVTIGSGPGALTISRASNTITDLVEGVSVTLQATSATPVTITSARDTEAAGTAIKELMDNINSTLSELGTLTAYNADAEVGGVLVGDSTARSLTIDLRAAISSTVNEGSVDYPLASSIGISLNRDGTFDIDESKLTAALENDFDAVMDLVLETGTALDSRVGFVSAGGSTVEGTYDVVVTQAAEKATVQSANYKKPNADTDLQIIVGGTTVDVTILQDATVDDAVDAFNDALSAAGVSSVAASKVQAGGNDRIQFDHSSYGSAASFEIIGNFLSLAGTYAGTDVAGTIGGEAATGSGRSLTSTAGDPTGVVLSISATAAEVAGAGGSLSLSTVDYQAGVFGALDRMLDEAEGAAGKIARARDAWQSQVDLIDDRIEILEDRIERHEALLLKQFAALETAMSTLSSQAAWLAAQLGSQTGGGTQ